MTAEEKSLSYEYIEIPISVQIRLAKNEGRELEKPAYYLKDVNPAGEVPAITLDGKAPIVESEICSEFLDDNFAGTRLMPEDPFERARARLAMKRFSSVIPSFYQFLSNQNPEEDEAKSQKIRQGVEKFVDQMDAEGPYFFGSRFTLVDIFAAPFFDRFRLMLPFYRSFALIPEEGSEGDTHWGPRLRQWMGAIDSRPAFQKTKGDYQLYLRIYESYANNHKEEGGRGRSEFGK
ncbi:hypothetical protein CYMTET_49442 [Cymbomonas tetramitiformis]|uniref:Glutathione S-transferase n=1 Tax=Cymbomonas tetramitiformis TaxID=36881 RepID=A0AAE0BQ54_9CHLO|nr:hypothetical protein CYMTET_49442 [Cymbomonas tetramitiformis]